MPSVQTVPVAEAVDRLAPDDSLAFPLGPGQPATFLHALAERDDWDGLELAGALLVDLYEILVRPGVRYRSGFYGPAERLLRAQGAAIEFVPADFRRFAIILEAEHPRVMCTVASPPDADGWMSLSLHAGASVAEMQRCAADPDRLLVVEINERFPRTMGLPPQHRHAIHVDEADVIVEGDRAPIDLTDPEPTEADRAIAEHVTSFIADGATLQTGIGGIPSTVAKLLAEGPGGDYGVHSEMFTTGLMHLHEAGKVTNTKGEFDGISVCTFAAGSPELYEWLDGNDQVRFLPVDVVNDPDVIAQNRQFVSINGALAIDLSGQVVADSLGGEQFSGIGGAEDFLAGAGLQLEDRSLVCLRSCVHTEDCTVSRIVPQLPAGSIVTTPRHQVDVVVTEHGMAELQGMTVRERALALAAISHPDHRDELTDVASRWPVD